MTASGVSDRLWPSYLQARAPMVGMVGQREGAGRLFPCYRFYVFLDRLAVRSAMLAGGLWVTAPNEVSSTTVLPLASSRIPLAPFGSVLGLQAQARWLHPGTLRVTYPPPKNTLPPWCSARRSTSFALGTRAFSTLS
jgi:hypothetical protein